MAISPDGACSDRAVNGVAEDNTQCEEDAVDHAEEEGHVDARRARLLP